MARRSSLVSESRGLTLGSPRFLHRVLWPNRTAGTVVVPLPSLGHWGPSGSAEEQVVQVYRMSSVAIGIADT